MSGVLVHSRDHQENVPGVDVGQADVDRELGAILVPSDQLHIESTGPSPGVCEVVLPVLGVDLPERRGHQRLDGLADQLVAVIAEQRFGLAINKPDRALRVHPHQGVRHSLQQVLEPPRLRRHLVPFEQYRWLQLSETTQTVRNGSNCKKLKTLTSLYLGKYVTAAGAALSVPG